MGGANVKDIAGQRFGRLVAVERVASTRHGAARWRFRCDCGNEKTAPAYAARSGHIKSCGCLMREVNGRRLRALRTANRGTANHFYKHGESSRRTRDGHRHRTPEYNCWHGMIGRCTRPSDTSWKKYGARGIKICERWRNSFVDFLADMGASHHHNTPLTALTPMVTTNPAIAVGPQPRSSGGIRVPSRHTHVAPTGNSAGNPGWSSTRRSPRPKKPC